LEEDDAATLAISNRKGGGPTVTLSFDADKNMTIAILSDARYASFFRMYVQQGTAYQSSPSYFELEGYIRSNRTMLRRRRFDVQLARGALEASDAAQEYEWITEREEYYQRIHEFHNHTTEKSRNQKMNLLEQALEVAMIHRLNEDLDVLSLYFMACSCRFFRNMVSQRMAMQQQQQNTECHPFSNLYLTVFLDGVCVSGESNFVRHHHILQSSSSSQDSKSIERFTEHGRIVEYQRCPTVSLIPIYLGPEELNARKKERGGCIVYRPRNDNHDDDVDSGAAAAAGGGGGGCYSWDCEEIALENLRHWRFDREYVGQKIQVLWDPHAPGKSSSPPLLLGTVRLESSPRIHPDQEMRFHQSSCITLDVVDSATVAVDDITTRYSGTFQIHSVRIDPRTFLRAAAVAALPATRQHFTNDRRDETHFTMGKTVLPTYPTAGGYVTNCAYCK
jgi:hypothetical protein